MYCLLRNQLIHTESQRIEKGRLTKRLHLFISWAKTKECRPAWPACESVSDQTKAKFAKVRGREWEQAVSDDDPAPVTIIGYAFHHLKAGSILGDTLLGVGWTTVISVLAITTTFSCSWILFWQCHAIFSSTLKFVIITKRLATAILKQYSQESFGLEMKKLVECIQVREFAQTGYRTFPCAISIEIWTVKDS